MIHNSTMQNRINCIYSLIKVLLVLFFLILPVHGAYTYRTQGDITGTGIFVFNISNATGTNNATHIFFNGHTQDFRDINVYVNSTAEPLPFWVDRMNRLLFINKTSYGIPYIYYDDVTAANFSNMGTTFLRNDSFDNLTLGDLNGQNGWSGSTLFDVQNTVVQNGTQAIEMLGGAVSISKTIPQGINYNVIFSFRMNDITRPAYVYLLEGATEITRIGMDTVGSPIFLDNVGTFGSGTASTNRWYFVQINITSSGHDIIIRNSSTNGSIVAQVFGRAHTNPMVGGINTITLQTLTVGEISYYDTIVAWQPVYPISIPGAWGVEGTDNLALVRYNNYTSNSTANFSVLSGRYINYSVTNIGFETVNNFIWAVNGTNQTLCTLSYCIVQFSNSVLNNVTINASNSTSGNYTLNGWNVTSLTYTMELQQPLNTSTGVLTPVTLYWRQWPTVTPHTFQIATDTQFIGIVTSGSATSTTENFSSGAVSLSNATKYYWRVRNATGSYSSFFEFTTSIATAVPGQINATVFDEQNYTRITNFTAQLYNSTTMLIKSTTTGWANFSSAEVSSGIYLLRIVPNSSYASRNVLVTSPTNATVYLPSTTNTINTIAFYLLDYTTRYPWSSSILSITKNNSVMHSSYFDADAKVAAYLIQGDSYGITITNSNNIHNWGNYIAIASGNVEIVLTDIAVNATSAIPFRYNLSKSNTDITLSWRSNHTLNNLNFTILKNNSILVHQLITTIPVGQSQYIVTDLNSVYYIYLTVEGSYYEQLNIFDPRVGVLRTDCGLGLGCIIGWGSGSTRYSLPQWMYNSSTVLIIWIIAGSFGAVFASFGILLGLVMSLLFAYWGWFSLTQIGLAFLGTVTIIAIVDYLRNKE